MSEITEERRKQIDQIYNYIIEPWERDVVRLQARVKELECEVERKNEVIEHSMTAIEEGNARVKELEARIEAMKQAGGVLAMAVELTRGSCELTDDWSDAVYGDVPTIGGGR